GAPPARAGRAMGPPTKPVVPTPPPPPEPVIAAPEPVAESFDFFEEDLDELLPAELADDSDLGAGDEVALDASDSPFAFGSSSQPPRDVSRPPMRSAERTLAMMPEPQAERAASASSQRRAPAPEPRPDSARPAAPAHLP